MKGFLSNHRIALFASGNGTNVQRICEYFRSGESVRPVVLFCNNPRAFVIERAKRLGLPVVLISKDQLNSPDFMLPVLRQYGVTHIVLAGFLALVPPFLIKEYPEAIVNLHPALLPKFGGKGMYGMHVHQAVVAAGETRSGITIHLIDEAYDRGKILFQAECPVLPQDMAEDVAHKIHELEQTHFPVVLERWLAGSSGNAPDTEYTNPIK